jgi:hypothetical protein
LKGDLAIVRGDQVYSVDTRPVNVSQVFTGTLTPTAKETLAQTMTPTTKETSTRVDAKTPTPQQIAGQVKTLIPVAEYSQTEPISPFRPVWLIPLLIFSLIVLTTLVFVVFRRTKT